MMNFRMAGTFVVAYLYTRIAEALIADPVTKGFGVQMMWMLSKAFYDKYAFREYECDYNGYYTGITPFFPIELPVDKCEIINRGHIDFTAWYYDINNKHERIQYSMRGRFFASYKPNKDDPSVNDMLNTANIIQTQEKVKKVIEPLVTTLKNQGIELWLSDVAMYSMLDEISFTLDFDGDFPRKLLRGGIAFSKLVNNNLRSNYQDID